MRCSCPVFFISMMPGSRAAVVLCVLLSALASVGALSGCRTESEPQADRPRVVVDQTWRGYKRLFIGADGRVSRPRNDDTVSEGQAYAMLRAVWMRDKETFDRCYRWSEEHLSRAGKTGDHLLAWRWKDGAVADWMPASDADIDYALSLLLAEAVWPGRAPKPCKPYGAKADRILGDILSLLVANGPAGRPYLLPWILRNDELAKGALPQNPSYYSPAHFRIFFERSKDPRWLSLVDTGYRLLGDLSTGFAGIRGVGLVPDWCAVDRAGRLIRLDGKSAGFGWEALRIPFRLGLDWYWFGAPDARRFLARAFAPFIVGQWQARKAVYSEYAYDGACANPYESPAYYAAYAVALEVAGSAFAGDMVRKSRFWLQKTDRGWYYQARDAYFVNSLAWIAEGFRAGVISRQ